MDTFRAPFADACDDSDAGEDMPLDLSDFAVLAVEEPDHAAESEPPPVIGADERRMQVRAYNAWAQAVDDRRYPDIARMQGLESGDFADNGVLIDFSSGIENPLIPHIGTALAAECGVSLADGPRRLSDIPHNSLLSRITDHYVQILANQAPIGFEAEFVDRNGAVILYRGILMPFSRDERTIQQIYGVLNWKPAADAATTDQLAREMGVTDAAEQQPYQTTAVDMLRAITPRDFRELPANGEEFALLLARRADNGICLLGEVPHDAVFLSDAAHRLLRR